MPLNRETTDLEARLIERTWDSPPPYTTTHRPRICSVYGDTVSLNSTTVSELKQYHLETLKGVLEYGNREAAELEAREQARREQVWREHRQQIEGINETLSSD